MVLTLDNGDNYSSPSRGGYGYESATRKIGARARIVPSKPTLHPGEKLNQPTLEYTPDQKRTVGGPCGGLIIC